MVARSNGGVGGGGARIRAEPPSLARLQLHRLALAVEGQVGIDHAAANGFDHAVQLCIDLGIAGLFMEHPAQGGDKDQRPGLGQGGLQGVRLFQQGGKRGDFCRFFVHAQQRLQRAALGLGKLRHQAWLNALRQYLQLLAGEAEVVGIDLDAASTPLVQ